jgi:hypothetical protein
MPGTGPRGKHWAFTLDNYTPNDVDRLSIPLVGVEYIVFGKEVSESGIPKLQGVVCFQSRKRLSQVLAVTGKAHCSITRFILQYIKYCKKDGDFIEVGLPPRGSGERPDIEDFKASVKKGVTSLRQLMELHSSIYALHPRFVTEYVNDHLDRKSVTP